MSSKFGVYAVWSSLFLTDLKDTRLRVRKISLKNEITFFIQAYKLIPLHEYIKGELAEIEVEITTARRAGNQQAIITNEKTQKKIVITNEHRLGNCTIYEFVG